MQDYIEGKIRGVVQEQQKSAQDHRKQLFQDNPTYYMGYTIKDSGADAQ
ncbi:hypothetical protein HED52_19165 [Ochrobactrum ciceri]|uniref:Uncharacterized protein n=1 Tax=Brucella ciceri TaxID=391287 RepID=A0ABX1DWS0_9HYPH|nr:hypothetical protein [Brucella ciceri]